MIFIGTKIRATKNLFMNMGGQWAKEGKIYDIVYVDEDLFEIIDDRGDLHILSDVHINENFDILKH